MAHPVPTTGLLNKGVALHMVAYSASPSFSDSTIVGNLQEYPDLIGAPSEVETTCLENSNRTYIAGIKESSGTLAFTFLYEKGIFKKFYDVSSYPGHDAERQSFCLEFPDGVKITWSGYAGPSINGAGVNSALQFTANINCDSDFVVTGLV